MIAAPAVDVRGGRCVQLVGGRPETERVSLPDPVEVALGWRAAGFGTLHLVDLDAALGSGENRRILEEVVEAWDGPVQVGGGIRDDAAVDRWLARGSARVVVGTRGVEDPGWLERIAARHPGRVLLAADVRGDEVVVRGWASGSGVALRELVGRVADLPLAGLLCTDVEREGRMEGTDGARAARLRESSAHRLWMSGGITHPEELDRLAAAGIDGVVLGMALYTGALDPETVAHRYGGES